MALILNKTTTGITSMIVVSGNTEEFVDTGYTETKLTKTGYIETTYFGNTYSETTYVTGLTYLNYTDSFGGINLNPYAVINSINIDRKSNVVKIVIFIYRDVQAKIDNKTPLNSVDFFIIDINTFNLYFSMSVLENSNIFKNAYEYLSTVFIGWESDE